MLRFWSLILTVAATPALSASWICKSEQSAGLRWNKETKQYASARFNAGDTFLIRPATDVEVGRYSRIELQYVMVVVGSDAPIAFWDIDLSSWMEERPALSFPVNAYFAQFSPAYGELVHYNYYSLAVPPAQREMDVWLDYARCSKLD